MANYPLDVIQSKNWKLTLPDQDASEILIPTLLNYSHPEWFYLTPDGSGIVMTAPTNGGTTENSENTRCELREMKNDGKERAAWNSGTGQHSMVNDLEVTALPIGPRPYIVIGQIHDSSDDVTVFRLEASKLWITNGDTSRWQLVTDNYRLGEHIQLGFHIENGEIRYSYNGQTLSHTMTRKRSGCYFKIGSYCQARGIVTSLPNGKPDYAQIILHSSQICHDGVCTGKAPGGIVPGEPPDTDNEMAEVLERLFVVEEQARLTARQLAALKAGLVALAK